MVVAVCIDESMRVRLDLLCPGDHDTRPVEMVSGREMKREGGRGLDPGGGGSCRQIRRSSVWLR